MDELIGLVLIILALILGFLLYHSNKRGKQLLLELDKYKDIIDAEEYKRQLTEEADTIKKEANEYKTKINSEIKVKQDNYTKEKTNLIHTIDTLKNQKRSIESELVFLKDEKFYQEQGIYSPIFNFDDSEDYKYKLSEIKEEQKEMIKDKEAATCSIEWMVDGSKAKGRTQTNNNIKLVLRAFNGECDAAIAKVKYNNIVAIEKRIEKAFDAINKAVSSNSIVIDRKFLRLKINELKITHELKEKQFEEKEEQRRIKEQIREEERAIREIEKAKLKAEQEEEKYQEALDEARLEIEQVTGAKHDKMMQKILKLEAQLLEAQENKQRAISRAQMTRSGHVYVISNIGSFGEDVFKVGMTRRLEPLDRVKELGDASVPFLFDVHAMIFSEDAPKLEKELHRIFRAKRVNMVNDRKEFFNISLNEIKTSVEKHHGTIEFTLLAEAKEYRETLALKSA